MAGIQRTANQIEHLLARKAAQQTATEVAETGEVLKELLWEQKQTNKMLWALLSEEQRAGVIRAQ